MSATMDMTPAAELTATEPTSADVIAVDAEATTTTAVPTASASTLPETIKVPNILHRVRFREVRPTDIPACYEIEAASYPEDEAASKSVLQYRQHHAAPYFRCAILLPPPPSRHHHHHIQHHMRVEESSSNTVSVATANAATTTTTTVTTAVSTSVTAVATSSSSSGTVHHDDDEEDLEGAILIGFVCSTRCREFTNAALTTHIPTGPCLAIHSIAVHPDYRRQGVATALLKDYIKAIRQLNKKSSMNKQTFALLRQDTNTIESIVLLAKEALMKFYLFAGFSVVRPSTIVHGSEQWYDMQLDLTQLSRRQQRRRRQLAGGKTCFMVDAFCDPQRVGTGNPSAVVFLSEDDEDDTFLEEVNTTLSIGSSEHVVTAEDQHRELEPYVSNVTNNYETDVAKQWMQMVAAEFNLSETAFVWRVRNPNPPAVPEKNGEITATTSSSRDTYRDSYNRDGKRRKEVHYAIRYYTPRTEVDLCGHATLASAAVLYQTGEVKSEDVVVFHARQDRLQAQQATSSSSSSSGSVGTGSNTLTHVTMEFPTKATTELVQETDRAAVQSMLHAAFGVEPGSILYMGLCSELGDVLIELTTESFAAIGYNEEQLRYNALVEWNGYTRGVIVCCLATPPEHSTNSTTANTPPHASQPPAKVVDFYSRFFAPKVGIHEDPVTGSAYCALAPYFASKLTANGPSGNVEKVVGQQRSKRAGVITCQLIYNNSNNSKQDEAASTTAVATSVKLTGAAATVMTGNWLLPL